MIDGISWGMCTGVWGCWNICSFLALDMFDTMILSCAFDSSIAISSYSDSENPHSSIFCDSCVMLFASNQLIFSM
jgi:hypothetical protein